MSELNTMQIGEHTAVIVYDPEAEEFRGEFVGLNGGGDFYGSSVEELRREGEESLRAFLEVCAERGITPVKQAPASFPLRLSTGVYYTAKVAAEARGMSLNSLIESLVARGLGAAGAEKVAGRRAKFVGAAYKPKSPDRGASRTGSLKPNPDRLVMKKKVSAAKRKPT